MCCEMCASMSGAYSLILHLRHSSLVWKRQTQARPRAGAARGSWFGLHEASGRDEPSLTIIFDQKKKKKKDQ